MGVRNKKVRNFTIDDIYCGLPHDPRIRQSQMCNWDAMVAVIKEGVPDDHK